MRKIKNKISPMINFLTSAKFLRVRAGKTTKSEAKLTRVINLTSNTLAIVTKNGIQSSAITKIASANLAGRPKKNPVSAAAHIGRDRSCSNKIKTR